MDGWRAGRLLRLRREAEAHDPEAVRRWGGGEGGSMENSPLGWKRGVRLKKIKSCDLVPIPECVNLDSYITVSLFW